MRTGTKRIAKNTLVLYFRQILIMLVSLYTVRIILNVLGTEDYGIYNVVAGVVTMFNFLSSAMASASQRYFSVDLGKNDIEHLKITFNVTLHIYIFLIFMILLIAESVGLWFVNHKLVIPSERLFAANWIYQSAVISLVLTLITTPYKACIIAHENMNVYAYVSIIEVVLRLGIVFILQLISFDKLIVYGILLTVVAFINTYMYRLYCRRNYAECHIIFIKDWIYFKELFSYGGWNLIGSFASVLKTNGVSIIMNLFFGPVVNAARGISAQVSNTLMNFSSNFSIALRPQIIKNYAQNNKEESFSLVFRGSRFCFFLFVLPGIPVFLNSNYIFQLWLKDIPENTVLFTRLVLLDCLVDTMRFPLLALMHAQGNMKLYQLSVSGFLLLNLPLSYFLLKIGMPAFSVLILAIVLSFFSLCVRVIVLNKLTGLSILKYFINVLLRCLFVLGGAIFVPIIIHINWPCTLLSSFFLQSIVCLLWTSIIIFFIGFSSDERKKILAVANKKIKGIIYEKTVL